MSLKERIQEDWKAAMKNKDKFRANVLNMAKAAILQAEKTDGTTLDDEQIISVLNREVKQRRDSIEEFEKGNRQDLVEQVQKEIEILLEYLPQQLTEEEISEIVKEAMNEVQANSIKDMGKVMAIVMPKVKGRADGKLVNQIVKQYLQ
ncbi:GatB/YqeY domain-containing protein [Thermobrachium celere]|uniref:Transamidase GatB domain protein n=1 Tax=Thermobrachium celere DSM 8682 TaxID=941824 RepID=R7RPW4_9CLOT|nr:GatB/YqeY domain-containing protein [Thermobrachium celere]GFR34513.1 aspartyl-tRNA amidotransferase subunit B [Thermobrachium celere]CDF58069.1 Transamidase GatB domain protein [Thermobrachium celere DSM 8682]